MRCRAGCRALPCIPRELIFAARLIMSAWKRATAGMTAWWRNAGAARSAVTLTLSVVVISLIVFLLRTGSEWPRSWPSNLEPWKNPKLDILVQTGLWWGGVVSLSLMTLLLATSRWWLQTLPPGVSRSANLPRVTFPTFWLPILVAILLTALQTWPRLSLSANGDELYNLRRYIMGSYKLDNQLRPVFRATDWQDAFFENRSADNHIPFSVAARASLKIWQATTGSDNQHFHEIALRLPAWLAGLTGIAAIAVFLWVAGYPRAGVLASFLAALHPWYLRFTTEASGYILSAVWIPLACAAMALVWRTGSWRWWLTLAGALFMLMVSVLGAAVFAGFIMVGLSVAILVRFSSTDAPPMQMRRLLVVLAISLAPLAILYGPSTYQIVRFLVVDRVDQPMGTAWLLDAWAQLTLGMPWHGKGFENQLIHTVESLFAGGARLPWMLAIASAAAVLGGTLRLCLAGRPSLLIIALSLLLGGPLLYALAESTHSYLLPRYIFFVLPGILALMSLGIDWLSTSLGGKLPHATTAIPILLALAIFAIATHSQRSVVMNHPRENLKAVSSAIHGTNDPLTIPSEVILRGHVWSSISHYDPWSRNTVSDVELRALIQEALERDIPLYFSFGYRDRAMTEAPVKAAVELAENPLLFEPIAVFPGLDQDQFTHRLFRFRGAHAVPHL